VSACAPGLAVEMGQGAPNTAEHLRAKILKLLGKGTSLPKEVPEEVLYTLAEEREVMVQKDVEMIAETFPRLADDALRIGEFLQHARDDVQINPTAPIRFRPRPEAMVDFTYPDKTSEIVGLASELIRIPSVTASPQERLDEVHRAATMIYDYARNHRLEVRYFDRYKYPALLIGFPGQLNASVMLSGHFDVVEPEPDDSQFEPVIEGDYLWGRGAADMKTVVATYLVWMKDMLRTGQPYPSINLLLVGNEENGEMEAMGTPHVLKTLAGENGYAPELFIAGERTGEKGSELWGEVCVQNRGVMRFEVIARGQRGHSGTGSGTGKDLTEKLLQARLDLMELLKSHLTLSSSDGWQSQARFPFINIGTPGVYNIVPDAGVLGVEVRTIPQDDLQGLCMELAGYCQENSLDFNISVMENGIACNLQNPLLKVLIDAITECSGNAPFLGRKLPGTSARFAPGGQGVVWGQSGIGPHAKDERHYIPSISPYYQVLEALGKRVSGTKLD
jgi:succinyl-diaminopimelate desuccinylase